MISPRIHKPDLEVEWRKFVDGYPSAFDALVFDERFFGIEIKEGERKLTLKGKIGVGNLDLMETDEIPETIMGIKDGKIAVFPSELLTGIVGDTYKVKVKEEDPTPGFIEEKVDETLYVHGLLFGIKPSFTDEWCIMMSKENTVKWKEEVVLDGGGT